MVYTGMTDGLTVAMSPIRTGTPLGVVRTTMFSISEGCRVWPVTSVSASAWLFSINPGESIILVLDTASRIPGTVTWASRSLAGSG